MMSLRLPEGEVEAKVRGEWESIAITDNVGLWEMLQFEEEWPYATEFRYTDNTGTYYWVRGAVDHVNKQKAGDKND